MPMECEKAPVGKAVSETWSRRSRAGGHQNRKYRWASGSHAAGSEVRISPSACTS